MDMPRSGGHEVTGERSRPPRRTKKSKIHGDSSSGSQRTFRGVRQTRSGKWVARVQDKRSRQTFSTNNTAKEATLAYDKAARELRGNEPITNFLTDSPPPTLPSEMFDFRCSELFAYMDELWMSFRYTSTKDSFASIEEVVESIQ